MEPAVALALMTKAQLVFGGEGTVLSFPVRSPVTFTPAQLDFVPGPATTPQDLVERTAFARITGVMPSGPLAPDTSGEMLWEVWRDAVKMAEAADGTVTPAQQQAYDAARALLYAPAVGDSVLRADSPAYATYKTCRDAVYAAVEAYNAARVTALSSTDPAVRQRFDVQEPTLRAEIDAAEKAWATTGRKAEIEQAIATQTVVEARKPREIVERWRTAYLELIDEATDGANDTAPPAYLSPPNALAGEWLSLRLGADEVVALAAQAPAELTAVLGTGGVGDIESLSFEARSVAVTRPWLPSSLTGRFWRLGPDGGELCDGGMPPRGRCPSVVAALVLARRITVQTKDAAPATPGGSIWELHPDLLSNLGHLRFRSVKAVVSAEPADGGGSPGPAADGGEGVVTEVPRVIEGLAVMPRPELMVIEPRGAVRSSVLTRAVALPTLTGPAFDPPPAPTPDPGPAPSPVAADEIQLLAYVCKPLPRCPDPDPALPWPGESPPVSGTTPTVYAVRAGDTLARIAQRFYGSADRWPAIAKANKVKDPRALRVGQRLTIP